MKMQKWEKPLNDFEKNNHIIVWWTSQTWSIQWELLDLWENNIISTWSANTTDNLRGEKITTPIWLKLGNENQIKEGIGKITDILWDTLVFWEESDLTLHAMSMRWMSHTYPQELVKALEDTNIHVASALYISYEDGFSDKNRNWSHVFYPVRKIKQDMEFSVLSACENAKIIDLITFDSPSAKPIGFTFLGVVGDFINFMEKNEDNPLTKEFKPLILKFLGDDYANIIKLFSKYPLRGELWKWQESMKYMAEQGTLNAMISTTAKNINFAKFSRISGVISDLYLLLAMNDMNLNRKEILSSSWERVLLDWERISWTDTSGITSKIKTIHENLEKMTSDTPVKGIKKNTLFQEMEEWKNYKKYEYDVTHLNFLSHHMGINPYFLAKEMIIKSQLVEKTEFIKVWKPKSKLYTWNKLIIQRDGDKVYMRNPEKLSEVFCEVTLWLKNDMEEPEISEEFFSIPDSEREKTVDESSFPHSLEWGKAFLHTIPSSFQWVSFSKTSALTEHLGFQIANLLVNNPNQKHVNKLNDLFPKFKKFDPINIQWIFMWEQTLYQDTDMEKKLRDEFTPKVHITSAAVWGGSLHITIEVFDDENKLIWKYKYTFT